MHTPGPWHRTVEAPVKYASIKAGKKYIAGLVVVRGFTDAEYNANANLIASAPELLALSASRGGSP